MPALTRRKNTSSNHTAAPNPKPVRVSPCATRGHAFVRTAPDVWTCHPCRETVVVPADTSPMFLEAPTTPLTEDLGGTSLGL